ncbi:type II toxin-antitoxin system VapC family toxin [Gordonia sp. (in: high G+C Gram-positive bacteria)]|uniref:type II toxin-antitoxin system VapC family toxin n=1 Tax=Gordonia sp. (in: high G+C Gram-positive bacteria) TaxID=84139 RepID=UPI001DE93E83|nr:type II toxin-antitoxin system VapC family toxin [Gordonia sp. (in: high G+C Gram-positive bacteria)]MCB1293204.1 type II toxin-antitoxin system VapC family toxin [Gordonia sp. (in: high G+C Gram-positive bacteria)]HMS74780.1 type II toxin-antitoxin system VapC family toxin [Gordonia sp. (in: high G+C Gram-positive bacteria)]HQV19439.1 type II toxin-antitoxin system VapC family toxin [Gordonia sp. (in: high G+C Gram-positive bacteria)]
MTYLLDTNVVSELRKRPGQIDENVSTWGAALAVNEQFLSSITVFEIELGILRIERRDELQGKLLRRWFDARVIGAFEKRTLPVDREIARRAALLHLPDPRPERDAYIAATALVRGLTVATRNVDDFVPMGVAVVNPWLPAR